MKTSVKRVYEKPSKKDGSRILVDRLWPRGITKINADIDFWAKDITPSGELRSWFHEDPESRFKSFEKKYLAELKKNKKIVNETMLPYKEKTVTLVTAVKDIPHSHIPTLFNFINSLK